MVSETSRSSSAAPPGDPILPEQVRQKERKGKDKSHGISTRAEP